MKKIFVILLLCLTSCTKDNLPEFNKLDGLRILAFQAATPEVNPGMAVTLTPIISDIGATSLNFSASSCIDPGISFGADPSCDG